MSQHPTLAFLYNGPIPASFSVYFRLFNMSQFKFIFLIDKSEYGVVGFEPRVAGWKVQMNPLSYGGTPNFCCL